MNRRPKNGISGFIINKKYAQRPRFEDDEDIVEAFTTYDDLCQKKQRLEKALESARMKGVHHKKIQRIKKFLADV